MSLVTEVLPLPVSVIEIVVGVIEYVKSVCVTGSSIGLKSRVIAWYGDIGQCTQMNTASQSETRPANPGSRVDGTFTFPTHKQLHPLNPDAQAARSS